MLAAFRDRDGFVLLVRDVCSIAAVKRCCCCCTGSADLTPVGRYSDMSVILWDLQRELDDPLQRKFEHHTEFVVGIDFNLFFEGQIATCSWDETVDVIPL